MATPKVINEFNYRSSEEIDAFYTSSKNSDEDTKMWRDRIRDKLLIKYFQETKGYKDSSLQTQLSKHWTCIKDGRVDAKVSKFQAWNLQKRLYWKNEYNKKYAETSQMPENVITRVSEVNIDYKEMYEDEKREVVKLQMKLQQKTDELYALEKIHKKYIKNNKTEEVAITDSEGAVAITEEVAITDSEGAEPPPIVSVPHSVGEDMTEEESRLERKLKERLRVHKNKGFTIEIFKNSLDAIQQMFKQPLTTQRMLKMLDPWFSQIRALLIVNTTDDIAEEIGTMYKKRHNELSANLT